MCDCDVCSGWGKVASSFAIPSLGMVPPDQRTEALRGLMTPLLTGPLANIMNAMLPGRNVIET